MQTHQVSLKLTGRFSVPAVGKLLRRKVKGEGFKFAETPEVYTSLKFHWFEKPLTHTSLEWSVLVKGKKYMDLLSVKAFQTENPFLALAMQLSISSTFIRVLYH